MPLGELFADPQAALALVDPVTRICETLTPDPLPSVSHQVERDDDYRGGTVKKCIIVLAYEW